MAWGTPAHSQDCNAEVLVTLTTQLWGGEISYTISDDNGPLATGDGFTDYGTFTSSFCADGRLMANACNEVPGTTGDWLIDASSWTPGLYVVHASQGGQTQQLTWIKLH